MKSQLADAGSRGRQDHRPNDGETGADPFWRSSVETDFEWFISVQQSSRATASSLFQEGNGNFGTTIAM